MQPAAFGCRGNTIRLRSGRYFDLADPKPDQFTLSDIAAALSNVCRFGGHVPRFYSVAEHSVHCAAQAEADRQPHMTRLLALLHDAAEAFTGDLVKPLKIMLPGFVRIEAAIETVIGDKYGPFLPSEWAAVKEIDRAMLMAEKRAMFVSRPGEVWTGEETVRPVSVDLWHLTPAQGEAAFTEAAARLGILPTY